MACAGIVYIPIQYADGAMGAFQYCDRMPMAGHRLCERCGKHPRRAALLAYLLGPDWAVRQQDALHEIGVTVPKKLVPGDAPSAHAPWASWLAGVPTGERLQARMAGEGGLPAGGYGGIPLSVGPPRTAPGAGPPRSTLPAPIPADQPTPPRVVQPRREANPLWEGTVVDAVYGRKRGTE